MTCRHSAGDPNCSSHPSYQAARERERYEATTPDANKFEVSDGIAVGPHLVLKVKHPSCSKCEFEGNKVMVFLNVSPIEALKWKTIDPHFRSPVNPWPASKIPRWTQSEAPSPAARFPATDEGWADALNYAKSKHQAR